MISAVSSFKSGGNMDFFELIKTRRSIRRFADKPVENEKIIRILESIRQAPSWSNLQCWRVIVVSDGELRNKISEFSFVESYFAPKGYHSNPARRGLSEAPIVIILCADPLQSGQLWQQPYYLTDAGIASENLMLAAHALGLGTVFVGVFQESEIKKLLGIPSAIRIVGLFPVGYPLQKRSNGPERKSMDDWVYHERWSS
jgi:nitroreductase